jgi:Amidohydrolase
MGGMQRRIRMLGWPGLVLLALLLLPVLLRPVAAPAAEPLPIFDAHAHYSQDCWAAYPTEVVISKLAAAGVLRALVSSSPDEGTLALYRADPQRFVPELRPYRGRIGSGNWTGDAETPAYLRGRLGLAPYVGLGEFHLFDAASARLPTVRQVAALAVQHGLLLHIHSDAAPVQAILEYEPTARILWAHAGMTTPPEEVRAMVERHAKLWVELAFREHDVLRDGTLDPVWRALLVEHSDRFLVGSDTYTPSRWSSYGEIIADHRRYLALLPPPVARAIAYGNAVRLFGAGGAAFPSP